MRSLICATRRVIKKRLIDWTVTAPNWVAGGLRQRVFAATLTVVAATMLIVGAGIASIDQADAAPMCPGPTTADGLACCAPGSTPTGDDTCNLPGVAAACPLSQLTSTGTCQLAGGSSSAPGCPLGQLDKAALSCCPSNQTPQADGSCKPTVVAQAPMPTCPAGSSVNGNGQCQALPVCHSDTDITSAGYSPNFILDDGNTLAFDATWGCCPLGYSAEGFNGQCWLSSIFRTTAGCIINGGGENCVEISGPITAPTCPTNAFLVYGGGEYSCIDTAPPSCPPHYEFSAASGGICVLEVVQISRPPFLSLQSPPCPAGQVRFPDGNCGAPLRGQTQLSTPSTPSPSPPPAPPMGAAQLPVAPATGCTPGYTLSADGKTCMLRPAGTPVGPAPIAPVGTPGGLPPTAPAGTPFAPTRRPICPPGQSQVPGAKPGTCKSCPSGTHPNTDGACVGTTTNKSATPTTTLKTTTTIKTMSPTIKPKTPTLTLTRKPSTPAQLHVNAPKLNLSRKPIMPPRAPMKLPVGTPAKTTS